MRTIKRVTSSTKLNCMGRRQAWILMQDNWGAKKFEQTPAFVAACNRSCKRARKLRYVQDVVISTQSCGHIVRMLKKEADARMAV